MAFNWRKRYAIKQRFDSEYNWLTERPGIYLWNREDGDITYFYVGQAKNLKNRRFNYYCIECGLSYPTRHFEASLKKHKDWEFQVLENCTIEELDAREKYWIDYYNSLPNHITRNELIAGNDIVKSNAKRIHNVYTKYNRDIAKHLKNNNVLFFDDQIVIHIKLKKDGTPLQKSKNSIIELTNWMKGLLDNGPNN